MHARVVTLEADTAKLDDAISIFKEKAVPRARESGGLNSAMLLIDRSTGRTLAVTLWESEEAMMRTEKVMEGLRKEAADISGSPPAKVERYEVAVLEQ